MDMGLVVEEVSEYIERHEGERRGWVRLIDEIESAISIDIQRSTRHCRLCDDETDDIAKEEQPALVRNNDVYERERLARIATRSVTGGKEKKRRWQRVTILVIQETRECSLKRWIASREPEDQILGIYLLIHMCKSDSYFMAQMAHLASIRQKKRK